MPEWLYDAGSHGPWTFLLLTVVLGGTAAFVSGKSIAETWRPLWQVPVYMVVLAAGVRFLHFALFEEKLLSPGSFAVNYLILITLAVIGFRLARSRQMQTQYGLLRG